MADGVELMARQGFHLGYVADSDVTRVRVDGSDGPVFHVEDSPTLRVDTARPGTARPETARPGEVRADAGDGD
jgi:hypothetical protein